MWTPGAVSPSASAEPNPFAKPDFLVLSCRYFDEYSDAKLVIAEDGAEFKGVVPIARTGMSRMPPRKIASTRGYPRAVACLDTPLVDRSGPWTRPAKHWWGDYGGRRDPASCAESCPSTGSASTVPLPTRSIEPAPCRVVRCSSRAPGSEPP